jgi:hypothetical protein
MVELGLDVDGIGIGAVLVDLDLVHELARLWRRPTDPDLPAAGSTG